jgi:gliding motility-associated-like protein
MATNNPDYGVTYPLYGCINDGTIYPIIGSNYISGGVFNSIQTGLNINPITGVITTQNSNSDLYQITYTAEVCGSFIPDTFDLQLMPIPNLVELTGGTYNCQNQSFNPIVLTATGTANFIAYYTINDSIFSSSSTTNQLNLGTIPGEYQLDSISDLYCTNSISGAITIDSTVAPVTPIIQGDSIFCYNSTISPLTVTNASEGIRWYGNSGLTQFLGSNPEFLPNNQVSQTYFATQTINGCEGESASFTITINPCDLIIPSAFTPNNDGDNDFWNINQLDIQYPENTVWIYNRWGEPIYESTTGKYADKPWDGKYKEALLPVGTYYYVIQLTKDNSIEPLNGIVTLILKK